MGHAGVNVRYKQVPSVICEMDPNVKSFSGYADVGKDQHIFFWMFEARNQDATQAPLTVWLNGGPGASSMLGLFQEMGPCGIDPNGNPYNNPYSFTNLSNVLFIDQPVGTGLSYSVPVNGYIDPITGRLLGLANATGCPDFAGGNCGTFPSWDLEKYPNSTDASAPAFWKTLQGFMGAFPEYSRGSFHLAAESYGGKYGPAFAAYLEEQNAANIPDTVPIKLESLLLINPYMNPAMQFESYYRFLVSPGNTYDYKPLTDSIATHLYSAIYGPGNCLEQLRKCDAPGGDAACAQASVSCSWSIDAVYDTVTTRDEYDLRELKPDPFPYTFFYDYLNRPDVQVAIGATTNWTAFSDAVYSAFQLTGEEARTGDYKTQLKSLLDAGVTVAVVVGDADYLCNWFSVQAIVDDMKLPGWSAAGFVDVATSDGVVHGQTKQAGLFSFTRVYESGHEVPFYQPLLALELVERVITGHDVATGRQGPLTADFKTVGPATSDYREGNATVQFSVTPSNSSYQTTSGRPGVPWQQGPPPIGKRWLRNTRNKRIGRGL
ncbi:hypothetical protein P8C59_005928 [Phyllachora maydis]|uniref:Carboxypeptidase n=2 Tax=Phyllachora maydis TaxID=1825666 RepID=A0AAD9I5B2_9PEZI|nr:hypothetical protein P8C59_005928 [Phyllachora maydis]